MPQRYNLTTTPHPPLFCSPFLRWSSARPLSVAMWLSAMLCILVRGMPLYAPAGVRLRSCNASPKSAQREPLWSFVLNSASQSVFRLHAKTKLAICTVVIPLPQTLDTVTPLDGPPEKIAKHQCNPIQSLPPSFRLTCRTNLTFVGKKKFPNRETLVDPSSVPY